MKVLYVSYNGLLEPIGRSQIFRYVVAQSSRHEFTVISFEKDRDRSDDVKLRELRAQLQDVGASWLPLTYRNRPRMLGAIRNVATGAWHSWRLARRGRVDVLHARSYLGALMALPARIALRIPLLFDMRGFWPDEGVGVGRWARGSVVHRILQVLERILIREAAGIVVLTDSGEAHLRDAFGELVAGKPVAVVPTCADLARFTISDKGPDGAFVLGYAGSANEAYLFEEFLRTFEALRRRVPSAHMLILNRHDHAYIEEQIRKRGLSGANYEVKAVDPEQVPSEMRRMDVGTIFILPYEAKIGSAPTKMAEFLASGVPCLGNEGCGDVAKILECERVGVSIGTFSDESIVRMIDRLLQLRSDPALPARCRDVARRRFSLEMACQKYDAFYSALAEKRSAA